VKLIGILGGVASGKTFVTRALADLGAGVLDADRVGHEVLCTREVEDAVRRQWGEGVFGPDGHVDRARLAGIVFSDSTAAEEHRRLLEQLLHPEIGRRLGRESERLAEAGRPAAVLDAPLLVEAAWDRMCDLLVYVDAPRPLRLARALERGWSEKDFAAREGVQESLDSKRRLADVVIDTSRSPEDTRAQVERFWRSHFG
jgi:dephospho-CoA kinase